LNLIGKGKNYGWPVITYGMNYDGTPITNLTAKEGMEQPVTYWVPSIAVSSIAFYTGSKFPQWKGQLFLGALAGEELRRLVIKDGQVTHQEVLFKGGGRVRDVVNAADGFIYLTFDGGRVARLVPADAPATASR
jgi:glucose/arabinose dehydrogenase